MCCPFKYNLQRELSGFEGATGHRSFYLQSYEDGGSVAEATVDDQFTAMGLDDGLAQAQAEAVAFAFFPAAGFIRLVEWLGNAGKVIFGYAGAEVAHRDLDGVGELDEL